MDCNINEICVIGGARGKISEQKEGEIILKKKLACILMAMIVFVMAAGFVNADGSFIVNSIKSDRYEMMWNDATDAERYFMPTEVKAYACGISTNDFIFFARVVEGEGLDSDEEITDKTLIAVCVLNRIYCKSWPTPNVNATLKRPGQFEVVDRETGECKCARSLDSEWAIVLAYRYFAAETFDVHMVYYNSLGFTGYSNPKYMAKYAYFGGNYFSCIACDCEKCTARMPDWKQEEVEMLTDEDMIYRPEGVGPHYK